QSINATSASPQNLCRISLMVELPVSWDTLAHLFFCKLPMTRVSWLRWVVSHFASWCFNCCHGDCPAEPSNAVACLDVAMFLLTEMCMALVTGCRRRISRGDTWLQAELLQSLCHLS